MTIEDVNDCESIQEYLRAVIVRSLNREPDVVSALTAWEVLHFMITKYVPDTEALFFSVMLSRDFEETKVAMDKFLTQNKEYLPNDDDNKKKRSQHGDNLV